jgi:uncharacterized protein YggE
VQQRQQTEAAKYGLMAAEAADAAADAAGSTPLEGGEIETSVSLQISFQMVR